MGTPSLDVFQRLYTPLVSDTLERLGIFGRVLDRSIVPFNPDPHLKVAGPAYPCRVEPTTEYVEIDAILAMCDSIPAGAMVLVAADRDIDAALWGGLMSTRARARGAVGAVINGGARDFEQIDAVGFPVFGTYRCVKDIRRRGRMAAYGVPVAIGGVDVKPGDIVFGDANGVIAIPQDAFERVHGELVSTLDRESATMRALREGRSAKAVFQEHQAF